jgi:hypothetical protein
MFVCVLCAFYTESELKILVRVKYKIACNWQNGLSNPTPKTIYMNNNKKVGK